MYMPSSDQIRTVEILSDLGVVSGYRTSCNLFYVRAAALTFETDMNFDS